MLPRSESRYRTRRARGATFFTSTQAFGDLSIVVKRFPGPVDARHEFVLVHGIGVSSRYFGPVAAELAKVGNVFLVDLPGYGAAPDPKRKVSIADHAVVLGAFVSAARLDNAVIVGHSMGSQVVSQLAVQSPEVTEHVVLMAPTLPPRLRHFWRAVGALLRDGFREPLYGNLIAIGDYFIRCGIPYGLRQVPHLLTDRIEDRLPRITQKTLVIRGDRDPIVSDGWMRTVTDLIPGARSATVAGPHVIMYTDPVRVAALIANHAAS